MKTTLMITLTLVLATLALVPTAEARPDVPETCDLVNMVYCDIVDRLIEDPRTWPCTCDPWPQPW